MLESSSAVQAINIDGEFQRDLPLTSRRDWADSLGLAPGVVSTQNGAGKVFYYLHGADFSSLVMQVDGADVASTLQNTNGYINLSTEAIQDVQIKTGAVDASTPIGTGAVLSVVTQSGTNHLKGAVERRVSGRRLEREQRSGRNDNRVRDRPARRIAGRTDPCKDRAVVLRRVSLHEQLARRQPDADTARESECPGARVSAVYPGR